MTIIAVTEDKIRGMESMDGLVLQGCGGSPEEWADEINNECRRGAVIFTTG